MLFETEPVNFTPKFEVASCFCECDGEILLLQRQDHKPQGGTWGVPAGKVDLGESPNKAVIREISEETGKDISRFPLSFYKTVYVRYLDIDFIYHMFHAMLNNKNGVTIRPTEHKGFTWVIPSKALAMYLIEDLDTCIKMFYRLE